MRNSVRWGAMLGASVALLSVGCAAQNQPLTAEQEAAVSAEVAAAGIAGESAPVSAVAPPRKKLDTLHKESFEFIVGTWPLTADEATPVCGARNPNSVGVEVAGVAYALNGAAETWEHWRDLHEVWAPNPEIPGAYMYEGDLLDFVQRHCAD